MPGSSDRPAGERPAPSDPGAEERSALPATAPRLLACDLDHTLVDEAGEPYPGVVAALGELGARGVRIVPCTGRTVAAAGAGARRLGLAGGLAIAYHGGVLADLSDGRWLERLDLPAGFAPPAVAALLHAGAAVTAYVEDERWEQEDGRHADLAAALEGAAVTRLVVGGASPRLAELLDGLLRGRTDVAVSPAPGERFELHPTAADKAAALARLCARLGVPPAGAVACGDGAPDAAMLRWAGFGIAVAEGDAAARAAADLVVPRSALPDALAGLVTP